MQEEAEALIKVARLDKDLPKLIIGLKTMWMTHVPQVTEISQIRSRYISASSYSLSETKKKYFIL